MSHDAPPRFRKGHFSQRQFFSGAGGGGLWVVGWGDGRSTARPTAACPERLQPGTLGGTCGNDIHGYHIHRWISYPSIDIISIDMVSSAKVLTSAHFKIVGRFETVEFRSVPNLASLLARLLWTAEPRQNCGAPASYRHRSVWLCDCGPDAFALTRPPSL